MRTRLKRKLKNLLPFIGIAIFFYLIVKIGPNKIVWSFSQIKFGYLFLAILMLIGVIFLLTYKWKLILKTQKFRLKFLYLLKLNLIGLFYGFITPARSGSIIRATYLEEKTKRPLVECGLSIVIERLMDLLVIFIFAVIGALLLAGYLPGLLSKIAIAFIVLLILIVFFISKKRSEFILKFIHTHLIPARFKDQAKDSFHAFYDSFPKLKKLIIPLILTVFIWIIDYSLVYLIARAFLIREIPYFHFITIFAIATVIGLIPITISGLGTREAALITMYGVFAVRPEKILAMSIVALIIGAVIPAIIGFVISIRESKVLK